MRVTPHRSNGAGPAASASPSPKCESDWIKHEANRFVKRSSLGTLGTLSHKP